MIPGVVAASRLGNFQVWTPADLAAPPKIWLNDSSPIIAAGAALAQWGDISGNELHMGQPSGPPQPGVVPDGLNGRRTVTFDAAEDYLQNTGGPARDIMRNTPAGWAMFVWRRNTLDATGTPRTLLLVPPGVSDNPRFMVQAGYADNPNRPRLLVRRLDADATAFLPASSAVGDTGWMMSLFAINWATGAGNIYLDGELDASGPMTSPGATSNTASVTAVTLGAFRTGVPVQFCDSQFAEVMVGSGSLPSSDEIDKLFGWAAHRYGLAGNLPADHPYKLAPP